MYIIEHTLIFPRRLVCTWPGRPYWNRDTAPWRGLQGTACCSCIFTPLCIARPSCLIAAFSESTRTPPASQCRWCDADAFKVLRERPAHVCERLSRMEAGDKEAWGACWRLSTSLFHVVDRFRARISSHLPLLNLGEASVRFIRAGQPWSQQRDADGFKFLGQGELTKGHRGNLTLDLT